MLDPTSPFYDSTLANTQYFQNLSSTAATVGPFAPPVFVSEPSTLALTMLGTLLASVGLARMVSAAGVRALPFSSIGTYVEILRSAVARHA